MSLQYKVRRSALGAAPSSRNKILATASSLALLVAFASAACAQDAVTGNTETVEVTGTRITASGFNAPTPTTVLGTDFLANQAEDNIFNSVIELPSLLGSQSLQNDNGGTSGGNNGVSAFSLLGLGTIRTLTLIDGERIVPANVTGIDDISELPQLLVQRVDVVTGGASASWGSDAVGGVVNFITDKNFTGFKSNFESGISTYGDNATTTAQVAAGSGFAGDRGHFEVSGEFSHSDGINPSKILGCCTNALANGRTWFSNPEVLEQTIANTPAGKPEYTTATDVQDFQLAKYGIITAGPLQGIAFQGDGTPYEFDYGSGGVPQHNASGTVVSPNGGCVAPFCIGGDTSGVPGAGVTLSSPYTRGDIYARLSYNITPDTNIWTTINWAEVGTENVPNPTGWKAANLTIQCSNAYLPASIGQDCTNAGITSFQFGSGMGVMNPETVLTQRDQRRYVVGADGAYSMFGKDFTWDSYYEHGENDTYINVRNATLTPYFNAAIDAVANPNGTIACRSTVAQAEGCVPFDIFGDNPPTQSQLNWLYGGNNSGPNQLTHEKQDAASLSTNGTPFSDWAGVVSLAAGAEYRQEGYNVTGDAASNGNNGDPLLNAQGNNWYAGNFRDGSGSYHVWEGFLEFGVPLIDNLDWGKADLDIAGRATDYSTSGYVSTWKVGGTWDTPLDGVRIRALQSRDVRAPNLSELYAAPTVTNGTVNDPFTGNAQQVQNVSEGNTALKPEKSQNTQLGIVYQPSWFPGFNTSVDYYRIGIKGEISSGLSPLTLCYEGFTAQCSGVVTVGGVSPSAPNAVYTQIISQAYNVASTFTDGFNIESDYQFALQNVVPGEFSLRALATHVSKFISVAGVPGTVPIESAGTNSGNIPHWKLLGIETYDAGKWNISFTETWISPGVYNRNWIQCTAGCPLPTVNYPTVNNDVMPGALYLDVGGQYNLDEHWQAYFKVDNVANISPPPDWGNAPNIPDGANAQLYDVIGRMYHVGLRLNM